MPEHPDEGVENRDSLSDDLESLRLQDLDSTLRGAPEPVRRADRFEFDLLGGCSEPDAARSRYAIFPGAAAFVATFGLWIGRCSPGSTRPERHLPPEAN